MHHLLTGKVLFWVCPAMHTQRLTTKWSSPGPRMDGSSTPPPDMFSMRVRKTVRHHESSLSDFLSRKHHHLLCGPRRWGSLPVRRVQLGGCGLLQSQQGEHSNPLSSICHPNISRCGRGRAKVGAEGGSPAAAPWPALPLLPWAGSGSYNPSQSSWRPSPMRN